MCNLYSMTRNRDAIIRLFRVSHNRAVVFEPQSATFPGGTAPIVRRAEDDERELVVMSWGFHCRKKKAPQAYLGSRWHTYGGRDAMRRHTTDLVRLERRDPGNAHRLAVLANQPAMDNLDKAN